MPGDSGGSSGLLSTMQNGVRALNNLTQTIAKVFPNATGTATTATAGSATLPANPAGFLEVVNPTTGAIVKVPYYAP